MKKHWGEAELSEQWSLNSEEHDLISSHPEKNWLGLAAQLKYLQIEGCFPRKLSDIPKPAKEYLAQQLSTPVSGIKKYNWKGRSCTRHRQHIRTFFGYRPSNADDTEDIVIWLKQNIFPFDHDPHLLSFFLSYRKLSSLKYVGCLVSASLFHPGILFV